jgi:hypothetical protein
MTKHDPMHFATALSAKLAARSRHVCAFFGAGLARACRLPDVTQLQELVLSELDDEDRDRFAHQLEGRNLEAALGRLRRISALITGNETVDGLTADQSAALDGAVCQAIVKALDITKADLAPVHNLAAWCARARYLVPVELFTVNYDLLLETALEEQRVPYFDGFVGTIRARFHIELVEGSSASDGEWISASFVRLWKLHGSVNWSWQDDREIVRLGQPVSGHRAAAIYPSDTKYIESRRVPFVVLQDRLRRALQQPETLLIVAGYSFGDSHLNELIFDAAARRERSEFIVFCFSDIPDVLVARAGTTPNLQVIGGHEAILGGVRAEWERPDDAYPDLWSDEQLALRDFRNLAAFLARSASREPDGVVTLEDLIDRSVAKREGKGGATANG